MNPTPTGQLDRPLFLRQLSTDEYLPHAYSARDRRVIGGTRDRLRVVAADRRTPVQLLGDSRSAIAAGLLELNREWGERFYEVPPEAVRDEAAASSVFDGPEFVIDVQTHFMAPHALNSFPHDGLRDMLRSAMPGWWTDLDEPVAWDLAYFIENVYLRTETGVAVLTSGPGVDDWRNVFNDEMYATRALVDGLAGTGRLLNHTVVHPNLDCELYAMREFADQFKPAGWKVYTMGVLSEEGPVDGWRLDDECGLKFLQQARDLDTTVVCTHKGLSYLAPNGSPADIGPAAKAFHDIDFLIYHSGYEMAYYGGTPEGPYTEATADEGVNRLITTALRAGVPAGANIYPELGTTWFSLVRRPVEAAHVLGKLIRYFGADNVIWGTDSIWYGSAQPLVEAFRAFQIPDSMCEEFGYAKLTPEVKDKILSANAARVYGIDVPTMRERVKNDDLAWARDLVEDYRKNGFSALR